MDEWTGADRDPIAIGSAVKKAIIVSQKCENEGRGQPCALGPSSPPPPSGACHRQMLGQTIWPSPLPICHPIFSLQREAWPHLYGQEIGMDRDALGGGEEKTAPNSDETMVPM